MAGSYEEVLVVTEYFAGPRSGVALFEGRPHAFSSTFADVHSPDAAALDVFELTPFDEGVDVGQTILAHGEFDVAPDAAPTYAGELRNLVVRWTPCGNDGV